MGSKSDYDVVSEAAKVLEKFNVPYELIISSAHRSPKRTSEYVAAAEEKGAQVFIAAAGMAALSDTGIHKTETVLMPVSEKYGIPLAQLGQIWQIQEPEGHWQGVITGITLTVESENGAPKITQSAVIDRYMDK